MSKEIPSRERSSLDVIDAERKIKMKVGDFNDTEPKVKGVSHQHWHYQQWLTDTVHCKYPCLERRLIDIYIKKNSVMMTNKLFTENLH